MDLKIDVDNRGAVTVVSVAGDIDIQTAPQLREQLSDLHDAGCDNLVLDLSGVDFLDSSALGVLVGANRSVLSAGGALKMVCLRENILKVLQITRLTEVIPVFDSVDAALV